MSEDQFAPVKDDVVVFRLIHNAGVELVVFAERCFEVRPDGQLAQKNSRRDVEAQDLRVVPYHQEASVCAHAKQPFKWEAELRQVEVDAELLNSIFVDDPDEPSDVVVGRALEQN